MAVILYCRVSTADQTLEHQRTQAEGAGFRFDEVIADYGVSGISTTLRERPELNVELSLPIFRLALAVFIPWRGAAGFDRRAGWHPRRWWVGSRAAPALFFLALLPGGAVELPGRSRLALSIFVTLTRARGGAERRRRRFIFAGIVFDLIGGFGGCGV